MATKLELAERIAEMHGVPAYKVRGVVHDFLNSIVEEVLATGRIELRGFGVLAIKDRAARQRRNPRTGEPVTSPPHQVVTFQPAQVWADRLAESRSPVWQRLKHRQPEPASLPESD